jgi:hypothetical protein
MADLYKVAAPDAPTLQNGNTLCKGKPIAYLIVWKSEKVGNETDPRTLAPFSGQKLNAGSPDDCGRYTYDAGPQLRIARGVGLGGWNQPLGFPSRGPLSEDRGQRQSSGSTGGGAPLVGIERLSHGATIAV